MAHDGEPLEPASIILQDFQTEAYKPFLIARPVDDKKLSWPYIPTELNTSVIWKYTNIQVKSI